MKRLVWCMAVLSVWMSVSVSGCASLRKKIVRKKKPESQTAPHYYRIQEYNIKPSLELYTKHYVIWRSWHKEIMDVLGENSKKDKMCINEVIGSLDDMKAMLVDEKGDKMDKHLKRLSGIRGDIVGHDLTDATKTRIRRTLEKEYKLIKVEFSYRKIGRYIRDDWRREEVKDASSPGPDAGEKTE